MFKSNEYIFVEFSDDRSYAHTIFPLNYISMKGDSETEVTHILPINSFLPTEWRKQVRVTRIKNVSDVFNLFCHSSDEWSNEDMTIEQFSYKNTKISGFTDYFHQSISLVPRHINSQTFLLNDLLEKQQIEHEILFEGLFYEEYLVTSIFNSFNDFLQNADNKEMIDVVVNSVSNYFYTISKIDSSIIDGKQIVEKIKGMPNLYSLMPAILSNKFTGWFKLHARYLLSENDCTNLKFFLELIASNAIDTENFDDESNLSYLVENYFSAYENMFKLFREKESESKDAAFERKVLSLLGNKASFLFECLTTDGSHRKMYAISFFNKAFPSILVNILGNLKSSISILKMVSQDLSLDSIVLPKMTKEGLTFIVYLLQNVLLDDSHERISFSRDFAKMLVDILKTCPHFDLDGYGIDINPFQIPDINFIREVYLPKELSEDETDQYLIQHFHKDSISEKLISYRCLDHYMEKNQLREYFEFCCFELKLSPLSFFKVMAKMGLSTCGFHWKETIDSLILSIENTFHEDNLKQQLSDTMYDHLGHSVWAYIAYKHNIYPEITSANLESLFSVPEHFVEETEQYDSVFWKKIIQPIQHLLKINLFRFQKTKQEAILSLLKLCDISFEEIKLTPEEKKHFKNIVFITLMATPLELLEVLLKEDMITPSEIQRFIEGRITIQTRSSSNPFEYLNSILDELHLYEQHGFKIDLIEYDCQKSILRALLCREMFDFSETTKENLKNIIDRFNETNVFFEYAFTSLLKDLNIQKSDGSVFVFENSYLFFVLMQSVYS